MKMENIFFVFCLFNLYSALAFRKQPEQLPTRDMNSEGNRDGKRKFKLSLNQAYCHDVL